MTRGLISIAAISLALTGGCASVMDQYPGEPPAWFVAAQTEVEGAGYPELADVPAARTANRTPAEQQVVEKDLRTTKAEIETQAPVTGPVRTADEIRATAAQMRAATEEGSSSKPDGAP